MNVPQHIKDVIAKPPPVQTEEQRRKSSGAGSPAGSAGSPGGEEPVHPSPGRTPPVSLGKRPLGAGLDTPRRVAAKHEFGEGSPTDAAGDSPSRKIWMRACNECGHELHVRRTKCTECGSLQTSKRVLAATKEEEVRAQEAEKAAALLMAEAEAAASQLALIAEAAPPALDDEAHRIAAAPGAADVAPKLPASAAATRAKALAEAVKRLTPEQLTKLRRMHKLKALLAKVPKDARRGAAGASAGEAADALAQLASTACM